MEDDRYERNKDTDPSNEQLYGCYSRRTNKTKKQRQTRKSRQPKRKIGAVDLTRNIRKRIWYGSMEYKKLKRARR